MKRRSLGAMTVAGIIGITLLLAAAPVEALSPAGKHYAGVLVLKDPQTGEVGFILACLSFRKNGTLVTDENDQGTWRYVEGSGKFRIESEATLVLPGIPIPIPTVGSGQIERTGPGSTVGGTMILNIPGQQVSAAFSATQTRRRACLRFAALDDDM
jgi:hypothetical protein